MKSSEVVAALGALAQESRLGVYHLLVKRGPEGYTPGELAAKLEIPAPTLSFHLKELQRVGLVQARREGRNLYYTADFTQMRGLVAYLTENCCSLSDQACDTDCKPVTVSRRKEVA
jgi:DNA-binding transcriptional ArsR family regulator